MKILLTNDDGINAEGLGHLMAWAGKIGEVTVCAPKGQQSGKSQSLNLQKTFEIKKVDYPGAKEAYYVDSTPADCVRFAFDVLGHFDLVLSGVNCGLGGPLRSDRSLGRGRGVQCGWCIYGKAGEESG